MGGTGKIKKFLFISIMLGVALMTSGFDFFNDFWDKLTPHSNEYGKFERIGDMHYARSGHKAVLLQDGRVLIVGGTTDNEAEIYDPKKKKFYKTGSMNEYRNNFTATLLQNGNVLITGGRIGNMSLSSTELYNPETGMFEKGPDMNYSRTYHTATLLPDGKVLVTGGEWMNLGKKEPPLTKLIKETEIYNPKINTFKIGPKIITPRYAHDAIPQKEGIIIVSGIGNTDKGLSCLLYSEIYDYSSNQFLRYGETKFNRKGPVSLSVDNNTYLLWEGRDCKLSSKGNINPDKTVIKNAVIISDDNIIGTIRTKILGKKDKEYLSYENPTLVRINNNKIFIYGGSKMHWGIFSYPKSTKDAFILNIEKKQINYIGNGLTPRVGHSATLLGNRSVLITGGSDKNNKHKSAELFILK